MYDEKFICAVLALVMVLSLAACGSKQDDNSGKTDVDLTAQEVLDKLKETLGDSYGCDAQDDEDRMTNYYGLICPRWTAGRPRPALERP